MDGTKADRRYLLPPKGDAVGRRIARREVSAKEDMDLAITRILA